MTEMGNGRWKNGRKDLWFKAFSNRAHCDDEEPDLRLAVVLQPSLLCWGEDQLFVTNTNGKASEIVSVHSNWWSELPRAYLEELVVALR